MKVKVKRTSVLCERCRAKLGDEYLASNGRRALDAFEVYRAVYTYQVVTLTCVKCGHPNTWTPAGRISYNQAVSMGIFSLDNLEF